MGCNARKPTCVASLFRKSSGPSSCQLVEADEARTCVSTSACVQTGDGGSVGVLIIYAQVLQKDLRDLKAVSSASVRDAG